MAMSKEQADAIADAIMAPAKQQAARVAASRQLRQRKVMPLRWRLIALLAGLSMGTLLYWLAFAQPSIWVIIICASLSSAFAQLLWNRNVET
jgi:hypothetical protein